PKIQKFGNSQSLFVLRQILPAWFDRHTHLLEPCQPEVSRFLGVFYDLQKNQLCNQFLLEQWLSPPVLAGFYAFRERRVTIMHQRTIATSIS
ncbi:MAG: hypothetical protein MJ193_02255, partial [Clostridia bacterium]|nr:hypothetical protein [Clostridia bacterium]